MDLDQQPTSHQLLVEGDHLAEAIAHCTDAMLTALRSIRFHSDNRDTHRRKAERRVAQLALEISGPNESARRAALTLMHEDDPELSFQLNEARGEELLLAQEEWDYEQARRERQDLRDRLKLITTTIYALGGGD